MKTYKAKYNNEKPGVFSVSLVNDPAMEGMFIAMSKDGNNNLIQLKEVDKEKQILIGLVMEPNKLIPRYNKDTKESFNIVFDEETIEQLSHNFFRSGFQNNSKLEHQEIIEGVTLVESWLVEDPKVDKSTNFGFEYPKGSWVATMKVDNQEIWNDFVKEGKVQGFSVDAFLDLEEIQLNKNNNEMETNKIVDAIKNGFAEVFNKPVELKTVKSGDTDIMFEGEKLQAGSKVFLSKDKPLAVGTYPLEGNLILTVDEEGVAKEVKEPVAVEPQGMTEEQATAIGEAIATAIQEFGKTQEARFKEITDANVALKTEVEKLSKLPAAGSVALAAQAASVALNAEKLTPQGKILNALRTASN